MMLSALRKTDLSSTIATQTWVENSYTPLSILIDEISSTINPKLSTIANLVSAETQKLDALSATVESIAGTDLSSLSTFVKKDDILSVAYLSSLAAYATNDYLSNNYALLSDVPSTSSFTYLSTTNALISTITNELSSNINPKLSIIADQVSAEVLRLDELSGKISGGGGSSIDDYISAITINGTTKTPVDKVVDIGNISSYVSELSDVYAPYARKVKVNDNTSLKGTLDLTFNTDHFAVIWDDDEPEPGTPESYDTAGTIYLNTEYLDEQYAQLSAHNSLVSSYTALESRVISTENLIGDILSILQEINDTEGE